MKLIPSEYQECKAFWQWIQTQNHISPFIYKICNEGLRTPRFGRSLKDIGLVKGVPDYHLFIPVIPYHGLYIEMKRRKGSDPDFDQLMLARRLTKQGYAFYIAKGWEDARDALLKYLGGKL